MVKKSFLLICFSLMVSSTFALTDQEYNNRLARISFIQNKVAFAHGDEVDWAAASINMPLQPKDRLYAAAQSRGEVEFDEGSVLRIAENTDLTLVQLDEDYIELKLGIGTATLRINSKTRFEIDTPWAAVTPLEKGVYRINLFEDGTMELLVRKGKAQVYNQSLRKQLTKGEQVAVRKDAPDFEISRIAAKDEWDVWNERRDAALVASTSVNYLPGETYMGVYDLDTHGRWITIPGYGYAWSPYVSYGWAPYRVGRWVWRRPWGWTWVSYEPWGWLPYHYGRWAYDTFYGWCWIPGPTYSFHFWSPGLVRFIRGRNHISWCPLGPRDYVHNNFFFYRSPYRRYMDQLNTGAQAYDNLQNRQVRGAITTVPVNTFVGGRLQDHLPATRYDPLTSGRVIRDSIDLRPTRSSRLPDTDTPFERTPRARYSRWSESVPAPQRPSDPTLRTWDGRTRAEGSPLRTDERENRGFRRTSTGQNLNVTRGPRRAEDAHHPNSGPPATITPVYPAGVMVIGPTSGGKGTQNHSDEKSWKPTGGLYRNETPLGHHSRPAIDNTVRTQRDDRRMDNYPRPAPSVERPSHRGFGRVDSPGFERRGPLMRGHKER